LLQEKKESNAGPKKTVGNSWSEHWCCTGQLLRKKLNYNFERKVYKNLGNNGRTTKKGRNTKL
jgi:hypothetical protein